MSANALTIAGALVTVPSLARGWSQRGTGRGERYFELAGVPQALLDRWSSRHHQVQAAIRDRLSATERDLRA